MSLEDSGSLEDLARRSMATAVDELLDEVPGLVNEVALQGAPSSSSLGVTRDEESEEKPDTPSSSNLGMTRDEEPERESDAPRARSLLDEVCAHLAGQFGAPLTVEQRGEVERPPRGCALTSAAWWVAWWSSASASPSGSRSAAGRGRTPSRPPS